LDYHLRWRLRRSRADNDDRRTSGRAHNERLFDYDLADYDLDDSPAKASKSQVKKAAKPAQAAQRKAK
jgi:hypothetical protein